MNVRYCRKPAILRSWLFARQQWFGALPNARPRELAEQSQQGDENTQHGESAANHPAQGIELRSHFGPVGLDHGNRILASHVAQSLQRIVGIFGAEVILDRSSETSRELGPVGGMEVANGSGHPKCALQQDDSGLVLASGRRHDHRPGRQTIRRNCEELPTATVKHLVVSRRGGTGRTGS